MKEITTKTEFETLINNSLRIGFYSASETYPELDIWVAELYYNQNTNKYFLIITTDGMKDSF